MHLRYHSVEYASKVFSIWSGVKTGHLLHCAVLPLRDPIVTVQDRFHSPVASIVGSSVSTTIDTHAAARTCRRAAFRGVHVFNAIAVPIHLFP